MEQERKCGDARVPFSTLQNGTLTRPPKMLARKKRASARRAARCRHKGISKQNTFFGDAIDVWCSDQRLKWIVWLVHGISACVPPPIVGKKKQNIRTLGIDRSANPKSWHKQLQDKLAKSPILDEQH
jgi:hypothetical protein